MKNHSSIEITVLIALLTMSGCATTPPIKSVSTEVPSSYQGISGIQDERPASDASIRELMAVMQSKKLLENATSQVDDMMQASVKNALAGKAVTLDQRMVIDGMRSKAMAIFKENMKWEVMEPMFIDIYKKSFTQNEVDGMLKFYKSDAGKAVTEKMPVAMHNTMLLMQNRMSILGPQFQKLQQDTIAQLRASQSPQRNDH